MSLPDRVDRTPFLIIDRMRPGSNKICLILSIGNLKAVVVDRGEIGSP